ncbi:nitrate/nitrite transport system substrate-binding protein [Methylacidimicrobium cyclopophantes]|uniref:Nitrate/nitrite transport system substrate-binding protein n=1 Tax=Methylacidimicrobium cyclopophantes TaxID=1041766 RepID=A0A5E6MJG6_9BACT|nr:CmpA/NrtA family ABC transporter substrate-binding protein [Methylacidimicrobium cyclopophantes]VVM08470.1 nitrate/nitrite transport system substrate-binding protein [Methylacidimicrobium cyclopophantes]
MAKRHRSRARREIRIGFVPLIDCAPFAVAEEMGLFSQRGLCVRLEAEPGWATIRDKVIYRELDAAHAVCGLPYSSLLGIGSVPSPAVASLVLNLQGNVLILSKRLWEEGVRDPRSLRLFAAQCGRKPVLAVVSRFSAHHFLLHSWLRRGGLDPKRDAYVPILPPAQMALHLQQGYLDGYCVGEPWGSSAVAGGFGACAASSADLEPNHPEKVLLIHPSLAREDPETHSLLIASLLEACAWCDQADHRLALVDILASRRWLHLPKEWLLPSLCGPSPGPPSANAGTRFVSFARSGANDPSPEREEWVWRQLLATGVVPVDAARPSGVFWREPYLAAIQELRSSTTPAPTAA